MSRAASSASPSVDGLPNETLTHSPASSLPRPMASSTCDGSTAADVQALPVAICTRRALARIISAIAPGTLAFDVFGRRLAPAPLNSTSGTSSASASSNRSRSPSWRGASASPSPAAISQATPNPTIPGTLRVPLRMPSSCPPPRIAGTSRRLASLVATRAPHPFGPYILWALIVTMSTPSAPASNGTRPAACVASQCRIEPWACTISAASFTGCNTPVSLFAAITDTTSIPLPHLDISDSSAPRSSVPSPRTGTMLHSEQLMYSSSIDRPASRTDLCSVAPASMCMETPSPLPGYSPRMARLLASVAPDVKTTSGLFIPTRPATCPRASSTACRASRPAAWPALAGLPNLPDIHGSIASTTRRSAGVVAL